MNLPDVPISLDSSVNDMDVDFFVPCLSWAKRYDRGVGFFTSGWISKTAEGLANFASNGGKARWITSPILDEKDYEVFKSINDYKTLTTRFRQIILNGIDKLSAEIATNTLNALGWMVYDNILEFKFAFPINKLNGGDFHDKFGIFSDDLGNMISFSGSVNDSAKGFNNYESIKVFKSWEGAAKYIQVDVDRFDKLWNNKDKNLMVIPSESAIRQKLISLRYYCRPYSEISCMDACKWNHQEKAVEAFLLARHGILEMATGTGKTRTALKIISKLFAGGTVNHVIITAYGNDLLHQWEKEILTFFDTNIYIYKYFDSQNELPAFILSKKKCILLMSRDPNKMLECMNKAVKRILSFYEKTLWIFDEIHGMGSEAIRQSLIGKISPYAYRLGLSATPLREFDAIGNQFIEQEVGPIVFKFPLEDAIRKGILCEFVYLPFSYTLTPIENKRRRSIIVRYIQLEKNNIPYNVEDKFRELANIKKESVGKLPLFQKLLEETPQILNRCIIFVPSKEYGLLVQNLLIKILPDYHTYYDEDTKENLYNFAKGSLQCLITCKKISEGIDIKSVTNIILFSSDKGKLSTIQRLGRCLRIDPYNIHKKANVVDFICSGRKDDENQTDFERKKWLTALSKIRRDTNDTI